MILTKELIESLIADKYIGAEEFTWSGNNVEFTYKIINLDSREKQSLIDANMHLQHENSYLRGSLNQANKSFEMLVNCDHNCSNNEENNNE